jgi:hypothetical protein
MIYALFQNTVSSSQFSRNFTPFWPAKMPNRCYSEACAWAILKTHFIITLLVQMKDKSLLPCCQKIQLITTNPTTADSDFTQLSYSNSKNVNISLQRSIFKKTLRLNCVQTADFTGKCMKLKMFIGPIMTFGTVRDSKLPKISLPIREWELTFNREWDRDWDSRKCLLQITILSRLRRQSDAVKKELTNIQGVGKRNIL